MTVTHLSVATALGRPASSLTGEQIHQINWWIKVATTKIRSHFLKQHVPMEDLDPEAVELVVVEAVARKVTNPRGKRTERIDDYSYDLNPREATSQIHITDEEWDMLTPARAAEAFTIRTDLGATARHRHGGWWY